jgi:uncharacterized membrane protein YbaN (DUF454 family)
VETGPPSSDFPALAEHVVAPQMAGWRRWLYVALGWFFVGMAVLGAILPLLPTTPFLLLASYFFVRSSPRLNAWLLRSRVFGPFLRNWQKHRAVSRRVKYTALSIMPIAVISSATLGDLPGYLIAVLLVLAAIGMIVVLRLRVLPHDHDKIPATSGQVEPLPPDPLNGQQTKT